MVFGAAAYNPQTDSGRKLLAHELTHIVQQRAHDAAPPSPVSGTSSARLQRDRLAGTDKNERILDLGTREGLACCDANARPDDKNGFGVRALFRSQSLQ
jgi:hypothetical protein